MFLPFHIQFFNANLCTTREDCRQTKNLEVSRFRFPLGRYGNGQSRVATRRFLACEISAGAQGNNGSPGRGRRMRDIGNTAARAGRARRLECIGASIKRNIRFGKNHEKPFGTDDSGPEGQKAYRDCIKSRWAFQSADKACNHKARRPAYARAAILGFAFTVTIFRPLAPACCKNAGLASESVMSLSISDSSAKLNTAFFSSLLESHSR